MEVVGGLVEFSENPCGAQVPERADSPEHENQPLNKDLEKGRRKLDRILARIAVFGVKGGRDRHGRALRKAIGKVAGMITERRGNLLAPNVLVKVSGKEVVEKLPRTNTPEESEFRNARRHSRRINGNSDVERQFQRDGPGTLMVQNLTDRDCVHLAYGSMGEMAARFSKVSQASLELAKSDMGAPPRPSTAGNH